MFPSASCISRDGVSEGSSTGVRVHERESGPIGGGGAGVLGGLVPLWEVSWKQDQ